MTNSVKSLHSQKLESTAQELLAQGYEVIIAPSSDQLPFDLGNYQPDLVAFKGKGGLILEVKGSLERLSIDRFQELAERISEYDGWRFLLVTLNDAIESLVPKEPGDLPSWKTLQAKTKDVETLIQAMMVEPALLYLWSTIEALLRKRAIAQSIPIDRFPPVTLLNHMYSSGELSVDEFDVIRSILEKRNRVAHGLVTSLLASELEGPLVIARSLLEKWQETSLVG